MTLCYASFCIFLHFSATSFLLARCVVMPLVHSLIGNVTITTDVTKKLMRMLTLYSASMTPINCGEAEKEERERVINQQR